MARVRVPGVYFEPTVKTDRRIGLGETGVPAILGVAQRGPLSTPVKIQSVKHFHQTFGDPVPGSFLSTAVKGFFLNGGKTCFVLRVARIYRGGKGELARRARYEVLDSDGYPAFEFTAASEGSWGNDVSLTVEVPKEPRVQSFLTQDVDPDTVVATLRSTRGFEVGDIVRFRDGSKSGNDSVERYVTILRVRGNQIFWAEPHGYLFKAAAPTYVEPIEFNVFATSPHNKERFLHLSLSPSASRNVLRVINSESRLISVKDLESTSEMPERMPEHVDNIRLRGGKDGLDGIRPADFIGSNDGPGERFGLAALEENTEVDLITAPDIHFAMERSSGFRGARDVRVLHTALIDHCERMGDRFAILDLPKDVTPNQAIDWRMQFDSAFGGLYYPWLKVTERGRQRSVPCSGHMAGMYAKCDNEVGIYKAAANIPLEYVIDTHLVLHEKDLAELNDKHINTIRSFPIRGIRPWGARTLSSDPMWRYIPVRRIFNAVRRALYENTQWVVFEPNNQRLRDILTSQVTDFIRMLWATGYLQGSSEDEAFYVQCDDTNNTYDDQNEGRIFVDIGLAPLRPTEFISMRLEHTVEDRRLGDLPDLS